MKPSGSREAGFTLFELLLVLFVLILVYALAMPRLDSGAGGVQIKSAVRQLAAGLRKARNVALTEHRETALLLDVEERTFSITGDARAYALPGRLEYALFTAESEVRGEKVASVRFYPDGSSTGGRVTVSSGPAKQEVDIDWLTGRVKVL